MPRINDKNKKILCQLLDRSGLLTGEAAQANFDAVAGHQDPAKVADALRMLSRAGLLTGDTAQANRNAVAGHQDPCALFLALLTLNEEGLLTSDSAQANFDAVAGHQDPIKVADTLKALNRAGLLTGDAAQANRNAVAGHQDPLRVANALRVLKGGGLLTGDTVQANFDAVAGHQDPIKVADALRMLNGAGLLTSDAAQANRNAVAGHQDPESIADALRMLNGAGLLTGDTAQANRNAVAGHQDPIKVADALKVLNGAGLLTGDTAQANRNAVAGHQDPWSIVFALNTLNGWGLLTGDTAQANFDALAGHQDPVKITSAFRMLTQAGLLTGDNRNAVARHQDPDSIASVLNALSYAGLLTGDTAQANFNVAVITHTAIMSCNIWNRIPDRRLTQACFHAMTQICEENRDNIPEGQRLFIAYVNREILGIGVPQAGAVRAFNPAQSTHTASVHETVTQSAKNLNAIYGTNIADTELDKIIEAMSTWLTAIRGDSLEITAAKRCFPRLTAWDYFFTDPGSEVSTKQLLALVWVAIHDEKMRLGTLEDAKALFINGLYEIQRDDNISEAGVDDNEPREFPICASGTFNKIMEKLSGLHPAVEVCYITSDGAGKKFRIVVNETAMAYLRSLANTPEGYQRLLALIGTIKEPNNGNSAEPIWDIIKDEVTDRMFDEFKSLFNNNKHSFKFSGLMNTGVDVPLNAANMAELETMVANATPREGEAAHARQGGFFNTSVSSIGAIADISAPDEKAPRP